MSDADWDLFFRLVQKIVGLPDGMTTREKRERLIDEAYKRDARDALSDLTEWFWFDVQTDEDEE